jgi:diguanylate cyclase
MVGSTISRDGAAGTGRSRAFATTRRQIAFVVVVVAAFGAVVGYLAAGSDAGAVSGWQLAVAVLAFAVSQWARIPLRVGTGIVMIAWGDVGIVAVVCLVPAAWVPAAVCAGAVFGHAGRLVGARTFKRAGVVMAMAAATLGGTAAAIAISAYGLPTPVRVDLRHPVTVVPLILASALYYVVTSLLISSWIADSIGCGVGDTWLRAVRGKRSMLVGNVAVALAVAVVISVHVLWVAALAPVLWFLHRMYVRDQQTALQRRTWVTLADATRRLSQLDERAVAEAALRGAAEVFTPQSVEILLQRPSGRQRRYLGRTRDLVGLSAAVRETDGGIVGPDSAYEEAVRQLVVGGQRIGELKLIFPRPEGRQPVLRVHEQHAFSTYADALASALHDASANRQLQAMAARGAYDAVHDVLTGLSNRSTLIARGNARLAGADASDTVALLLLDINGLRAVNDALSYPAGDELLKVLARRLADGQVAGELLGRLGGDEFAVMLTGPGATDQWAHDRARELMSVLAEPAEVAGVTIAMEASAGVVVAAVGPAGHAAGPVASACDMAELLRRADVALHLAKRDGLRLVRYDPSADAASTDRLSLLAELRDALATTDQLMVYLQPIVDLSTGVPVGAEALVRWQHPRRGLLAPGEFIQAIEHSELAAGFTRHVLDMSLEVATGWAAAGLAVPVSVNVCARCLLDPCFPAVVADRLAAHAVAPERLIVEITEAVMGAELDIVSTVVAGLRDIGVPVSVDDFGTESASLALLTGFAVDEVKIDRSFVAALEDSPATVAIVRATVDLARQLGLRVVAQGVERPEQRAMLVGLGVHSGQGYLFAEPMTPSDAAATLRTMIATPSPAVAPQSQQVVP